MLIHTSGGDSKYVTTMGYRTLKIDICHYAKFVVTGCICGCHYDNLPSHQWRQSWYYSNSWFSANVVNSLRPSDAIWRQWSWTTLAQVMACCLTAPSHYLNQCWLIIRGVLWHTSESSFAGIAQGIDSGYEFEKDILKNIFKSPRGQWVKEAPQM